MHQFSLSLPLRLHCFVFARVVHSIHNIVYSLCLRQYFLVSVFWYFIIQNSYVTYLFNLYQNLSRTYILSPMWLRKNPKRCAQIELLSVFSVTLKNQSNQP
jgi:hypothetical protein